jgi:peptide/nickel transport system substrate-binding protein
MRRNSRNLNRSHARRILARLIQRVGRWWVALSLMMVMAIATGCNFLPTRTDAAQVPRLVISELSDPKTFNAVMNQEATNLFGLLYETLLAQNGLTGEMEAALAESWETSEDQLSITFTLRENLQWSDGEPFTVDDVLFTFNDIYFNPAIPSSEQDILRIGAEGKFPELTKLGDRQIRFTAPEPFAPLLRFAGGLTILPKHALEDAVRNTDENGNPLFLSTWGTDAPPAEVITNGAYKLVGYRPTQRIILERNPYYWRTDSQGNQQPYIERFIIELVESNDTSLMQFRSGGLDLIGVTPDYFRLIKREEDRGNFTIYEGGPTLTTNFLSFNLNKGSRNGQPLVDPVKSRWFNSLEFRRAIAHAIDRPTMINNIYQGLGLPQHSPIYQQSPYYLSPEAGLPTYDYDLEQARELLQQVGFRLNAEEELVDSEGNRVRFTLITNSGNKIREAIGAQIKQDLEKIGIQVDFQPIAFNTLIDKLSNTLDWEAHILGFSGAGVEPDGGRNVWSPQGRLHVFNQSPDPSQEPIEGWEVADWEQQIGDLYVEGGQYLDEERRKEIYNEVQKLAQEYVPFIYLVNPLSLSAVRNRVEGVKYSALGGSTWNIHELRLNDE